jgi:hypothetical protein
MNTTRTIKRPSTLLLHTTTSRYTMNAIWRGYDGHPPHFCPISLLWLQLAALTFRGTSVSRLQALQQSYLRAVLPLREKLVKIQAKEAEQRRRAQAIFPMTVTDFLAVRDKSHQLHICQFLMLDDAVPDKIELRSKRDAIMTTYQWVWRQVTPLCEEYAKNVSNYFQRASPTRNVEIPGRLQG